MIIYELFYMILVAPGIWEHSLYGKINPEEGISKFIVIFTYFSFFSKVLNIKLLFILGGSCSFTSFNINGGKVKKPGTRLIKLQLSSNESVNELVTLNIF